MSGNGKSIEMESKLVFVRLGKMMEWGVTANVYWFSYLRY